MLSFYIVRHRRISERPGRKTTGFFYELKKVSAKPKSVKKEVAMNFLIIVLAIHFVNEIISNKIKDNGNKAEQNKNVRHPAEYSVR